MPRCKHGPLGSDQPVRRLEDIRLGGPVLSSAHAKREIMDTWPLAINPSPPLTAQTFKALSCLRRAKLEPEVTDKAGLLS